MTTDLSNDKRKSDLMSEVRDFGRAMAEGKDSLPMLAAKVARAADDGVISTDKDADGEDDYTRIYADFLKAASKKAVHEHTTGGIKANASKLRQVGIAASKPSADFVSTLDKIHEARKAAIAKNEKVQAAYPAFVAAARTQNEQDDDLSDEQIAEVIKKPESEPPTLEKVLARVEKQLADVISGENGIKTDDPGVIQAHGMIRDSLAALMLAADVKETLAKAAKLGLTVTAPVETPAEQLAA